MSAPAPTGTSATATKRSSRHGRAGTPSSPSDANSIPISRRASTPRSRRKSGTLSPMPKRAPSRPPPNFTTTFSPKSVPSMERSIKCSEAIREALDQEMALDERVIVLGQGIDDAKGMWGTTLGLQKKYGAERVFDTPLAEDGMTGGAIG